MTDVLLSNNTFTGSIPSSLFGLKYLVRLSLDGNSLNGTLSSLVGNLNRLKFLYINVNHLSGSLPSTLFDIPELLFIDFHGNYFNGSIPSTIGNAKMLKQLDLANNRLSGSIPPEIGLMTNLRNLHAQENFLTGSIPEELYNCANLSELILNHMPLSGTISKAIINLTNLGYLYLQYTNISGTLPDFPSSLAFLTLNNMKLNGTLPDSLFRIPSLNHVLLTGNGFSGTIPASIGSSNSLLAFIANDNKLTGTIPESIGAAKLIEEISLSNNSLNGSIPGSFVRLPSIKLIQLDSNQLSGSIPTELYDASNLLYFEISSNNINGSISGSIKNMTHLNIFSADFNQLTGSIPEEIGELLFLEEFDASYNKLTGPIPSSICNCTLLSTIYLQYNALSKSLPECFFSDLPLYDLAVYNNILSGSLPSNFSNEYLTDLQVSGNELSGSLPLWTSSRIKLFQVEFNDMHGTLPPTLFQRGQYVVMEFDGNFFTGSLPKEMQSAVTLNYIDIFDNYITGTIPYIGELRSLATFYVDQNLLTGSLSCFNSSTQIYLSSVDFSLNQFTGTIPEELYKIPALATLSSIENCFTGPISDSICQASNLEVLALDGLHSAPTCRRRLLNGNYALQYYTPGTIPPCLFNLPKIQTLHLSGNGIQGSLPYSMNVSRTLTDLSLSYNKLTGSIPYKLQNFPASYFDLSYNLIGGELLQTIPDVPDSSTVYLQVNRLSGRIQPQLRNVETISILDSNIFQCERNRDQLPRHDSQSYFYECGTTSLQQSMYLFLVCWIIVSLILFGLYLVRANFWKSNFCFQYIQIVLTNAVRYRNLIVAAGLEYKTIKHLNDFIDNLSIVVILLTVVVVLLLMPTYAVLSHRFSYYENNYAWVVSSVFLSGFTPAITMFVLYVLFTLVLYASLHRLGTQCTVDVWENKRYALYQSARDYRLVYLGMLSMACFNFIVVLAVNIGYILLSTRLSPNWLLIIQILLAGFKYFWNDTVILNMTKTLHRACTSRMQLTLAEERKWRSRYLSFNVNTLLFNTIAIPCLATAVVSSECLYNVYYQPKDIVSTITFESCSKFESVVVIGQISPNCSAYFAQSFTTSFLPPYIYRFQCASTLVSTYAVVYVYKFILAGFARPLASLCSLKLDEILDPKSSLRLVVNRYLIRLRHNKVVGSTIDPYLFQSDRFVLRIIMMLAVFVTFGVMFPPLAFMICVSFLITCYFMQFMLGRFVSQQPMTSKQLILQYINQDAANTGVTFMKKVHVIGLPATFFYSYFIYDTYGDAVGAMNALWMTFLMGVLGLLCLAAFVSRVWAKSAFTSRDSDATSLQRDTLATVGERKSGGSSVFVTDTLPASNPIHLKAKEEENL